MFVPGLRATELVAKQPLVPVCCQMPCRGVQQGCTICPLKFQPKSVSSLGAGMKPNKEKKLKNTAGCCIFQPDCLLFLHAPLRSKQSIIFFFGCFYVHSHLSHAWSCCLDEHWVSSRICLEDGIHSQRYYLFSFHILFSVVGSSCSQD